MKTTLVLGMCGLALLTSNSFVLRSYALSLEEGKKSGLVGETVSGYLEPVEESPEAAELSEEINSKRRKAYKAIAEKNAAPLQEVEKLGAKEAIAKSPSGTLVKSYSGEWLKK